MSSYLATRIATHLQSIPAVPQTPTLDPDTSRRAPILPASHLRFGSCFAAALLAGSASPLAAPAAQTQWPQPTARNVRAVYSKGHTFITWDEIPSNWGGPWVYPGGSGAAAVYDETYVVYVSDQPITNVQNATRIVFNGDFYQIPEQSSRFYADLVSEHGSCLWDDCASALCQDFEKRHTNRLWARDDDAEGTPYKLANGKGVLVLTPAAARTRYYAVTTIPAGGTEYTHLNSQNVSGAVVESVEDPEPILLPDAEVQLNSPDCSNNNVEVYLQYMDPFDWNVTLDAPSRLNCYYGLNNYLTPSGSNRMTKAIQYAYTYEVAIPDEMQYPPPWPATLVLHGQGTPQEVCTGADQGSVLIRPYDHLETNWYGCARMYDYRTADPSIPVYPQRSSDVIVNYTEQRVLRALYDTCRLKPIDLDRLYVRGHSMGGGGALAIALRYPGVFAAAHASKPPTAFGDTVTYDECSGTTCFQSGSGFNILRFLWGDFEAAECDRVLNQAYLPPFDPNGFAAAWHDVLEYYERKYAGHQAFNVYQWQDHRAQLQGSGTGTMGCSVPIGPFSDRRHDDTVPIGIYHSYDDGIIDYCLHAKPLYPKLNEGQRTAAAELLDSGGHTNQAEPGFSIGMPPPLVALAGVPFYGHTVKRDETVPGLRFVGMLPIYPSCLPPSQYPSESYLTQIDWASSWRYDHIPYATPPIDSNVEPYWGMYFDSLAAVTITVDITPRRLQAFTPELDSNEELPYDAEIYVLEGQAYILDPDPNQNHQLTFTQRAADEHLLLTIEDVHLKPDKFYFVRIVDKP